MSAVDAAGKHHLPEMRFPVTPSSKSLALIKWSKPGIIYVARNRVNGKMYVGKTVNLLCNRKSGHNNSAINKNSKLPFHEAIRKYSMDSFEWTIVQRCNNVADLDEAEKWWIRNLKTLVHDGYNCAAGGSGHAGTTKILALLGRVKKERPPISEETREKFRQAIKRRVYTPETRAKMSAWQVGRKRPEVSGHRHAKYRGIDPLEAEKKIEENREKRLQAKLRAEEKRKRRLEKEQKPKRPKQGFKLSEEWKKKISDSHKGKPHPWLAGVPRSEETKRRQSEALKGKPRPWQRGVPHAHKKGYRHSEETKAKMSAAHKGKKMTPEQAERNRIAQMGKHAGPRNYWFGKERSEETKKKISEANLRFYRDRKSSGENGQMGLNFG